MKCEGLLKKVEFSYDVCYSEKDRYGCPFCSYGKKSKSKTYHTLKSLLYHVKHEHKDEQFPFSIEEIHELMHYIALARHLKVLKN